MSSPVLNARYAIRRLDNALWVFNQYLLGVHLNDDLQPWKPTLKYCHSRIISARGNFHRHCDYYLYPLNITDAYVQLDALDARLGERLGVRLSGFKQATEHLHAAVDQISDIMRDSLTDGDHGEYDKLFFTTPKSDVWDILKRVADDLADPDDGWTTWLDVADSELAGLLEAMNGQVVDKIQTVEQTTGTTRASQADQIVPYIEDNKSKSKSKKSTKRIDPLYVSLQRRGNVEVEHTAVAVKTSQADREDWSSGIAPDEDNVGSKSQKSVEHIDPLYVSLQRGRNAT